jgi:tRNA-2-methylthio-N6-dimethylallyladenosine synthase
MNICESEAISELLSKKGGHKVKESADADLLILNTCSVRSQAEQKAFSFLGRAEEMKAQREIKIVVIGCMAQRIRDQLKKRFKKTDLILGTGKTPREIADEIANLFNLPNTPASFQSDSCQENPQQKVAAFVPIMKGCQNFCSYCVVPFVRGKEVSFDAEAVLKECLALSRKGIKEITLLGQNVNSYIYSGLNFSALIKEIVKIDGLRRIRFMTNHPKDLSDELIETIAAQPKVCKHIHLPLQSASDKILEKMNRKYTFGHYCGLIKKLRGRIPYISITTDIIVGFPSESSEDFDETLAAVKNLKFGGLYAFRYSPRPNTKAASLPDDVPLSEKQKRLSAVLDEGNRILEESSAQMKGKVYEVLADRYERECLEAKTDSARKVFIKGERGEIGQVFDVLIKDVEGNSLFGERLKSI